MYLVAHCPHSGDGSPCEAFSFQELADLILFPASLQPKLSLSSLLISPDDAEDLVQEKDLTRSDDTYLLLNSNTF